MSSRPQSLSVIATRDARQHTSVRSIQGIRCSKSVLQAGHAVNSDRALLSIIKQFPLLCKLFFVERQGEYEATVQDFLKRLPVLAHVEGGPPFRESEFFSVTWKNTQRQRSIYIHLERRQHPAAKRTAARQCSPPFGSSRRLAARLCIPAKKTSASLTKCETIASGRRIVRTPINPERTLATHEMA